MTMHKFGASFVLIFLGWVILAGSIHPFELLVGLFVSLIIADICGKFMFYESPYRLFNPISIVNIVIYLFIILYAEIQSHIDVAGRIITGKINPAIIKIKTDQTTDFTKTLIANSITMTPGTVTLRVGKNENEFYIHCLGYEEGMDISGMYEKQAKKVIP